MHSEKISKQAQIEQYLAELIQAESPTLIYVPALKPNKWSRHYIRWFPVVWNIAQLTGAKRWANGTRNLLFEFINPKEPNNELDLKLTLAPVPANLAIREALLHLAENNRPPFTLPAETTPDNNNYKPLYQASILTNEQIKTADFEELKQIIKEWWDQFLTQELPQINSLILTHLSQLELTDNTDSTTE